MTTRNKIGRLYQDGGLDQTVDLGITGGEVRAVALQADGKVLIGGTLYHGARSAPRESGANQCGWKLGYDLGCGHGWIGRRYRRPTRRSNRRGR